MTCIRPTFITFEINFCSLSEEISEQRSKAEELWSKVGIQFVQENENDLKDKIDYLQETLVHYPPNGMFI